MTETGATQRFAIIAAEFCDYLEDGVLGGSHLRDLLATLDAMAVELPHVEPSRSEYADPVGLDDDCRDVGSRIGAVFGERSFYEIQAGEEPIVGDLRDDFFDIYRDLRRGIAIASRSATDAAWEWRFSHEVHWGLHARSAIVAIDRLDDGNA